MQFFRLIYIKRQWLSMSSDTRDCAQPEAEQRGSEEGNMVEGGEDPEGQAAEKEAEGGRQTNGTEPMSKRQRKRLLRHQQWEEQRDLRK